MNFVAPNIGITFFYAASPVFALTLTALLALLIALKSQKLAQGLNLLGIGIALGLSAYNTSLFNFDSFLNGSFVSDPLSSFGSILVLSLALVLSILMNSSYLKPHFNRGEVIAIWHMTLIGILTMISTQELISVFVGLEIASIGLYALIGYVTSHRLSKEGAIKYLILGSFASGFLLFGFALMYAGTGSMSIPAIVTRLSQEHSATPWVELGLLLSLFGFGFKLALAPFHMWAPDVYEASPTGLTAFMATAIKIMVMIVIFRFLSQGLGTLSSVGTGFFMFVAVMSSLVGNIMALVQSSVKRMLAYSSVAHAGYMAMALCALSQDSATISSASIVFYLITYTLSSLAAFACLMWLETEEQNNIQVDDLSGLATRHPWLAFALATTMFAFAGIPPTAGFMGKLFLFNSALLQGFYGIVLVGIIGAVISAYYYLRIIVKMYMHEKKSYINFAPHRSPAGIAVVGFCLVMTLLFGTVLANRGLYIAEIIVKTPKTESSH